MYGSVQIDPVKNEQRGSRKHLVTDLNKKRAEQTHHLTDHYNCKGRSVAVLRSHHVSWILISIFRSILRVFGRYLYLRDNYIMYIKIYIII